jgi:hypothetical protein
MGNDKKWKMRGNDPASTNVPGPPELLLPGKVCCRNILFVVIVEHFDSSKINGATYPICMICINRVTAFQKHLKYMKTTVLNNDKHRLLQAPNRNSGVVH